MAATDALLMMLLCADGNGACYHLSIYLLTVFYVWKVTTSDKFRTGVTTDKRAIFGDGASLVHDCTIMPNDVTYRATGDRQDSKANI